MVLIYLIESFLFWILFEVTFLMVLMEKCNYEQRRPTHDEMTKLTLLASLLGSMLAAKFSL